MARIAKPLRTAAAALLVAGLVSACASASSAPVRRAPARAAAPPASAAGATNAFGLDLMRRLPRGNLVFSPASIATALAMTGSGARGQTARQIASALRLGSPASFPAVGQLQQRLPTEQPVAQGPDAPTLQVADGLFVQSGFRLEPAFLAGVRADFAATPQQLDFAHDPQGAEQAINGWVGEHTHGLIPRIVSGLQPSARLVLANALYLHAHWAAPFKPSANAREAFHASSGSVTATFMHETTKLRYATASGYRAVVLPYADSTLALTVLLPVGESVGRLLAQLDASSLRTALSRATTRTVELSLPRFEVSTREQLNGYLQALGMSGAFSEGADFGGITSAERLHIGAVEHAADLAVDEEGTTAAAATTVEVVATAIEAPRPQPIRFDADRPFLFFLYDTHTGEVLFAGRLAEPTPAS